MSEIREPSSDGGGYGAGGIFTRRSSELSEVKPGYCVQETVARCSECSLASYGRDCRNEEIPGWKGSVRSP